MERSKYKNTLFLLSVAVTLSACGGGGGTTPTGNQIIVSACSQTAGDSTYDTSKTYYTAYTKSHSLGNPKPVYHVFNTRKLTDNSDVTLDYMVHNTSSPKAVVVLISGGGLDSKITGTEGSQPDASSGNFLVRSAHRYQTEGYRVITLDRPSDAADGTTYGANNIDIDKYRHSMQHAVDIANILKRENTEGYDVIISGTSRGSISAAAMNTLAAGITMSSALTSSPSGASFAGYPLGSNALPLSRVKRPSHVLLHTSDTCAFTLPANSRNLFSDLKTAGVTVSGNEVIGGFRNDNTNQDPCGAFDYHGFNGIETCAVQKETTWMRNLISSFAGNKAPIADNQTVTLGGSITLTAADTDGDTLSYAVPYEKTSLGGTVVTDSTGAVTYIKPIGTTGTTDSFAFTVTDGNGGTSTSVISITLP